VDCYRVELTPAVQRQLGRLSGAPLAALRGVILALADERFPVGAAKIVGARNLWRVRLRIDGRPWRVVHQVRKVERLVVVTRVVPRDEGTYRGV
jgi:mRNA-degrading endonuclease RelE of RelBE toxin-antitoxin system